MIQIKTIIPVLKAGDYIKIKQRPNFRPETKAICTAQICFCRYKKIQFRWFLWSSENFNVLNHKTRSILVDHDSTLYWYFSALVFFGNAIFALHKIFFIIELPLVMFGCDSSTGFYQSCILYHYGNIQTNSTLKTIGIAIIIGCTLHIITSLLTAIN